LKVDSLNLILQNNISIAKYTCLALCVGLGLSFSVSAGGRTSTEDKARRPVDGEQLAEDDVKTEGLQQTLNLNFSPERREKLRKALEDYARSVDPSHEQIEERRRAMQQSIETRFFEADNDNDGTLDRQEATEKLPQIARHFSSVDINQDNLISLAELEEAQARILERRKAAEASLEAERQQKLQESAEVIASSKRKNKQATNSFKKKAL
jgi:hypothetical protein